MEMAVAAIAGRMVFDDVSGEHDILIGHIDHRIASRVSTAELHDVDSALAEVDRHAAIEGGGRPGQAGNALMTLEQPREAGEFAVPVFLTALGDHGARLLRHDDLLGTIGRSPKHAHGMIMGETRWVMGLSVTERTHSITLLASLGVACASTIITLSSPMITPEFGSPSAVKAHRPSPTSVKLVFFSVRSPCDANALDMPILLPLANSPSP
jgi:hypothetical protein